MIGPAEFRSMNEDGTDRVQYQHYPAIPEFHSLRPPPEKAASEQREQRRNECAGQIERVACEWFQQDRQCENEIIERRRCVRSRPCWEVLEVVVPYDQSWVLRAHLHTRHPRVTIRIGEINIPGDKNILIICAARREDQYAENCDFNDAQSSANHRAIPNPRFKMRNPKFWLVSRALKVVTGIC